MRTRAPGHSLCPVFLPEPVSGQEMDSNQCLRNINISVHVQKLMQTDFTEVLCELYHK